MHCVQPVDHRRDTPKFPNIKSDAITPSGYGRERGDQPCFAMRHNRLSIYVPKSVTSDETTAFLLFSELMPTLDAFWNRPPSDRVVTLKLDGEDWHLCLHHAFAHLLVERLQRPELDASFHEDGRE